MRPYGYPLFIADESMKRLHANIPDGLFEDVEDLRKKCDIGTATYRLVDFAEAIQLYSEEAFRPCGTCLLEGGEVSNWKERAQVAEARNSDLEAAMVQSDKLAADWKERAEAAEDQNRRLRLKGEGQ